MMKRSPDLAPGFRGLRRARGSGTPGITLRSSAMGLLAMAVVGVAGVALPGVPVCVLGGPHLVLVKAALGDEAPLLNEGAEPHGPDPALLTVGRLRYGGGGDWYANPSSLPNLLRAIREQTGIPVADREVVVAPLDPELAELPFVHLTGHGDIAFTPEERIALRQWLLSGGFLHADDNYGLDPAFRREMALLLPGSELVELPPDHPIYRIVNAFPEGIPKIHEHDGNPPRGYGMYLEGRLVVFYSHETDLGNGWEDPEVHDLPASLREAALGMGVNLFVYALTRRAP